LIDIERFSLATGWTFHAIKNTGLFPGIEMGVYMHISLKAALGSATAAMVLTTPMPLVAADIQMPVSVQQTKAVVTAEGTADYYRRRYRYRHHDRVDAGDVLTGIGILAGIAIIADAASKNDGANRRRRDDDRRYDDRSAPRPVDVRAYGNNGNDVGSAVGACSSAVEQSLSGNGRVQEIRSVTREGQGWRVDGALSSGNARDFSCGVTGGQINYIRLDGRDI
jgi:hypothetical protein